MSMKCWIIQLESNFTHNRQEYNLLREKDNGRYAKIKITFSSLTNHPNLLYI